MTRKSSKPFLIKRFTPRWAIALLLSFCVGGSVRPSHAQQPPPDTGKEKKSYIRFWNMLPNKLTNNLLLFAGDKPLNGAAPLDLYNDYAPAPVGTFNLVVKRSGEGGAVLQRTPVALQEDMYVTVLVTEKNGQPVVEAFNDTPDPKVTDLSAQLIVRSIFPTGHVTVGVTGGQPPQPIVGGETLTLENVPMTADVSIAVQVIMPTTPPTSKTFNIPADFSKVHHATLFLIPDDYGRLRPKFFYNGTLAYPKEKPQGGKH